MTDKVDRKVDLDVPVAEIEQQLLKLHWKENETSHLEWDDERRVNLESDLLDAHIAFQVMDALKDVRCEDAEEIGQYLSESSDHDIYRTVKMSDINIATLGENSMFGEAENINIAVKSIEGGMASLKKLGLFDLYQLSHPVMAEELDWIIKHGKWAHQSMLIVAGEWMELKRAVFGKYVEDDAFYADWDSDDEDLPKLIDGNPYASIGANGDVRLTKLGREKVKSIKDTLRQVRETKKEIKERLKPVADYINVIGKAIKLDRAKSMFGEAQMPGDSQDMAHEFGTRFDRYMKKLDKNGVRCVRGGSSLSQNERGNLGCAFAVGVVIIVILLALT